MPTACPASLPPALAAPALATARIARSSRTRTRTSMVHDCRRRRRPPLARSIRRLLVRCIRYMYGTSTVPAWSPGTRNNVRRIVFSQSPFVGIIRRARVPRRAPAPNGGAPRALAPIAAHRRTCGIPCFASSSSLCSLRSPRLSWHRALSWRPRFICPT